MNVQPQTYAILKHRQRMYIRDTQSTDFVVDTVCHVLDIDKAGLKSPCRKRKYIIARVIIANHFYGKIFLIKIGELLGGRNHSTILYYVDLFKDTCETDKPLKTAYELCLKALE